MDIIVVLELDMPTNVRILGPDHTPADPENPVRLAHAAPADASGVCGPLTLCGLDTGEMTLAPHRFTDTDRSGVRPHWHTCSTCQTARQRTAPRAPEPATTDHFEDSAHPAGTAAR
ncbi:hypothetical protein PUR61_09320 [Streptomyces sp. BE20]|uniref:hypothetical protein n=1 Tax=unclassified Streptomyces TaxID=2593676 RepID=UPI002E795CBE|nr:MULTISPECIES: hypothetical protein [unclassified Streptomyces]MED7952085.1 hypothetical protein [Streptomyces sp. BE303]MEE1822391.1 hypothetical protein [Streptomyces sp. BE20]